MIIALGAYRHLHNPMVDPLIHAIALNGHGRVTSRFLTWPWTAAPNRAEKYLEPMLAAAWSIPFRPACSAVRQYHDFRRRLLTRQCKSVHCAVEGHAVRNHVAKLITRFCQDTKHRISDRLRGDCRAAQLLLSADESRHVEGGWNRMRLVGRRSTIISRTVWLSLSSQ